MEIKEIQLLSQGNKRNKRSSFIFFEIKEIILFPSGHKRNSFSSIRK